MLRISAPPLAGFAGRFAIPDPLRSGPVRSLRLHDEEPIMCIIDHISDLRAELAGSILTPQERAMLEAELAAALAARAEACRAIRAAELV